MTETMLPATTQSDPEKRELALLKAVGLDKVAPEQREIALAISTTYELRLELGHLSLIDGKPYITHKGLLHVAHRSKQFDGMETAEPRLDGDFWRTTAKVWRKDMSRPFASPGRYPTRGRNAAYGPEMAMVRAECLALRRAFDVALPVLEEKYAEDVEARFTTPADQSASLEQLAEQRAAELRSEAVAVGEAAPEEGPDGDEGTRLRREGAAGDPLPAQNVPGAEPVAVPDCGAVAEDGLMTGSVCILEHDHKGAHKSGDGSWPR